MQSIFGALLTAGLRGGRLEPLIAQSGKHISTASQNELTKSFDGAEAIAQQYPQYSTQITAAAKTVVPARRPVGVPAGIVAVLLGARARLLLLPEGRPRARAARRVPGGRCRRAVAGGATLDSSEHGLRRRPMATVDEEQTKPRGAAPVPHFSAAERAARGRAERSECPRASHAGFEPAAGPRSGRDPRGAGRDARARARPDPLRADARLAVHVLPRGGARSWRTTSPATPRAGSTSQLCGDAHLVELRRLRLAGTRARLRHQRLRRDAARAVRVGREAARRELRDRRPRPRLHGRAAPGRGARRPFARTASAMREFAGDAQPRRLVRAPRRRGRSRRGSAGSRTTQQARRGSAKPSPRRARRTA